MVCIGAAIVADTISRIGTFIRANWVGTAGIDFSCIGAVVIDGQLESHEIFVFHSNGEIVQAVIAKDVFYWNGLSQGTSHVPEPVVRLTAQGGTGGEVSSGLNLHKVSLATT